MGKFSRDYSEVERRDGGDGYAGEAPKPGIYNAILTSVEDHTSSAGNEGVEWIFEITDEPYEGWHGWVYTNEEGAAWKEVQILEAIGILKPGKDDINTTHEKILKGAKPCRVKVKNETYNDEKRGKITTILPPKEGSTKAKKGKAKDGDEDDPF